MERNTANFQMDQLAELAVGFMHEDAIKLKPNHCSTNNSAGKFHHKGANNSE